MSSPASRPASGRHSGPTERRQHPVGALVDQLIDEAPQAYKDIGQVMADQADLVAVEHTLHQILNYKGTN
jgi:RNA-splicing ligase RtcB